VCTAAAVHHAVVTAAATLIKARQPQVSEMVISKTIRLFKRSVFMTRPPFIETSVEDYRIAGNCFTNGFSGQGIQEK